MNILVVTNQFPSDTFKYKGSFVFQQIREVSKYTNTIKVVTPNYNKDKSFEKLDNIEIFRFKSFTKKTQDPLLRNLFKGLMGKLILILFVISQTRKILSVSRKSKIDLIHAHWALPSGFSAFLASIIMRKKILITSHGSDLTYCSEKWVLSKMLKILIKKSFYFICDTDSLKDIALSIHNDSKKIKTIYLGVSNNYLKYRTNKKPNAKKKSIIFVGSLYPIKGIKYLMESLELLSKKRDDFILRIVGGGELTNYVLEFIQLKKLDHICKFEGFLPHEETVKLISESDLAIQTSLSEGLSVVIQESIYLGKPIVATNVGGTKEIVKDNFNGFLIEPMNNEQFIEKVSYLLDNVDILLEMGNNSLEIAKEKLELEKNVSQITDLYQEILQTTQRKYVKHKG